MRCFPHNGWMIHCWISAPPVGGIKAAALTFASFVFITEYSKTPASHSASKWSYKQHVGHYRASANTTPPRHTSIFWFIVGLNSSLYDGAAVLMYPWRHIAIKWTAIVFLQNSTNCLIKATTWVLHLQPLIRGRDVGATKSLLHFPELRGASGWHVLLFPGFTRGDRKWRPTAAVKAAGCQAQTREYTDFSHYVLFKWLTFRFWLTASSL